MDLTTVYLYRYVLGFLGIGIAFGVLALVVPFILAPRGGHGTDTLKSIQIIRFTDGATERVLDDASNSFASSNR